MPIDLCAQFTNSYTGLDWPQRPNDPNIYSMELLGGPVDGKNMTKCLTIHEDLELYIINDATEKKLVSYVFYLATGWKRPAKVLSCSVHHRIRLFCALTMVLVRYTKRPAGLCTLLDLW
jgi:hypothetical protein